MDCTDQAGRYAVYIKVTKCISDGLFDDGFFNLSGVFTFLGQKFNVSVIARLGGVMLPVLQVLLYPLILSLLDQRLPLGIREEAHVLEGMD